LRLLLLLLLLQKNINCTASITCLKQIDRICRTSSTYSSLQSSVARSRGLEFFENLEARTNNAPV